MPTPSPRTETTLVALAALGAAATVWVATRHVPCLGDSNAWFATVAAFDTPLQAFDPALPLFRPLQHLVLWALAALHLDSPPTARLPALALHVANAVLLLQLGRALGLGANARRAGVVLFLAFPAATTLYWEVAVCGPGRANALLLALLAAVHHAHRGDRRSGALLLLACLLPPLWHETGVVAALLAAVLVAMRRDGPWSRRLDRWCWGALAANALWALFVLLRGSRVHGLRGLPALPANAARAACSVLPDDLRLWVLEALRAAHGPLAWWSGAAAVLALGALLLRWWQQAGTTERALLLVGVLDLVPAVLGSGYCQRYGYFAAGTFGLAAGLGCARRQGRARIPAAAACLLVAGGWVLATRTDLREADEAGRILRQIAADALAARASFDADATLVLVDLPPNHGAEKEVSLCNWGARQAMHRLGLPEPLQFWRTVDYGTSTEWPRLDQTEFARRCAAPPGLVLRWDADAARLREVARPR